MLRTCTVLFTTSMLAMLHYMIHFLQLVHHLHFLPVTQHNWQHCTAQHMPSLHFNNPLSFFSALHWCKYTHTKTHTHIYAQCKGCIAVHSLKKYIDLLVQQLLICTSRDSDISLPKSSAASAYHHLCYVNAQRKMHSSPLCSR
jgi:hypothetical protein